MDQILIGWNTRAGFPESVFSRLQDHCQRQHMTVHRHSPRVEIKIPNLAGPEAGCQDGKQEYYDHATEEDENIIILMNIQLSFLSE